MPAQGRDAFGAAQQLPAGAGRIMLAGGFQVDTHAASAGAMHVGQRLFRSASSMPRRRGYRPGDERVEVQRLSRAVGAGLDDDRALDAQGAMQRDQGFQRRVPGV